ncbi:hypothetical protein ACF1B0_07270 [Streptomyces anandii]|uniref:hypothetical protein n=1 Tax=Streptomyces anandii TaxID=285454 RepID=UPI0036FE18C8
MAQAGAKRLVNPEDVRGQVLPQSGSRHRVRCLNLQIETGSPPVTGGASLWSGMSGAALFSGDHLVGVITEDRAMIEGRLIALPVSELFGEDGLEEADAFLLRATGDSTPWPRVALNPVWAGGEVLRPAYSPLPPSDQWSEADLLESRYGVVPFLGRAEQLDALTGWCEEDGEGQGRQRIRLLSGGSTVGKTRLARELCRAMGGKGWVAGLVDPSHVEFAGVCALTEPRLLVVDDADAHAGQLDALLAVAAESGNDRPLRILAVAHSGGPWWQAIRRRYESLADAEDPPPLPPLPEAGRVEVYRVAFDAFCAWYRRGGGVGPAAPSVPGGEAAPVPGGEAAPVTGGEAAPVPGGEAAGEPVAGHEREAPGLDGPDFGSYLLLLIQALVDARTSLRKTHAAVPGPPTRSRANALLDYALDVERQRWQVSAERQDLPHDPVLLERVVAVSSLAVVGGGTEGERETEAARRLRLVPDLADQPEWLTRAFARWQHAEFTGDGYLRSLQPLRLAERLGAKVIAAFPDLAHRLLEVGGRGPGIPQDSTDQARQVLNVLHVLQLTADTDDTGDTGGTGDTDNSSDSSGTGGTDCADGPGLSGYAVGRASAQHRAREVLDEALRDHARSIVGLVKRLAAADQDQFASAIGTSLACALNTTMRKESAQEVAAQVLEELDLACPDVLLEMATAVAEHAVRHYRHAHGPAAQEDRRALARALQRWSQYLASSGMRVKAHEVAGQAVDTCHALHQLSPSEDHEFALAGALKDLADRLVDIGRFEAADDCARDAIRRLESLFQHSPTHRNAFGLVTALCTLATAAHRIGRQREALQAATEACELVDRLAREPAGDAHGPDEIQYLRASALRGLAWQLGADGRVDQAVEKATESVEAYEALREKCPGLWKRDIAEALSVLGVQHAARQEWDESIERHTEALNRHYDVLERRYREAVRPQHALALGRLADAYLGRARSGSSGGRREDLLRALEHVEHGLRQYDRMRSEDQWANRVHEAWTNCLHAEILLALDPADRPRHGGSGPRKEASEAEKAARRALDLYDQLEVRAWRLRFNRAHAQAVLAQSYGCGNRPRSKVIRVHEQARNALVRLDAEEPGRAEEELRAIDTAIAQLRQTLPPGRPRGQGGARGAAKRRRRQQPKPGLRTRRSMPARRRHH